MSETILSTNLETAVSELTQSLDPAQVAQSLEHAAQNEAAVKQLEGIASVTAALEQFNVALRDASGAARKASVVLHELKQARERELKASGKGVYMALESDNVRLLPSGAVYVASKQGWRRVKGAVAEELRKRFA